MGCMNIENEKQQIIQALQDRDEPWLIIAMKKLLDLDKEPPFSDEHKALLEQRLEAHRKNPSDVILFQDVKNILLNEGRWQ